MKAAVRIRGKVHVREENEATLRLLGLTRVNHLVLVKEENVGMLKKVNPYVAWGNISPETLKELILRRGRLPGNKKVTEEYIKEKTGMSVEEFAKKLLKEEVSLEDAGIKKVFRLRPPSGGHRSIKKPYPKGAWGFRPDMDDLVRRMM